MDQTEKYSKLETASQSNQFLKRALQFVVPVSLLILLSHFKFQLSTLLFPIFTPYTLETKYMFILCNGILVFLFKTSASTTTISDSHGIPTKNNEDSVKPVMSETENGIISTNNVQDLHEEEEEEEEGKELYGLLETEVNEKGSGDLIIDCEENEEDDGEKLEKSEFSLIQSSSSEEKGNEEGNLSTEELNRKFDEFIRKMKEEIRIEPQRQLIAVSLM